MKRAIELTQQGDGSARTLMEITYARLKSDIIWGRLAPDEALRSDWLRSTYDVGISPLREALSRLSSEGFVASAGQRGFRVAALTAAIVHDTAEARILIEGEALRRSIAQGDLPWETEIAASIHSLTRTLVCGATPQSEAWSNQHRRFHFALIAGCGSDWLLKMASSLFDHSERHRMQGEKRRVAIETAGVLNQRNRIQEHEELARTVLAGNADAAVRFLERHYRITADAVVIALGPVEAPVAEARALPGSDNAPRRKRA